MYHNSNPVPLKNGAAIKIRSAEFYFLLPVEQINESKEADANKNS